MGSWSHLPLQALGEARLDEERFAPKRNRLRHSRQKRVEKPELKEGGAYGP